MAKRGYNRDTIRGGASDWDVSRPFSSYLRVLGTLITHPVGFYEVLPKVPDPRAPGLFLAFCGVLSAVVWLAFWGWIPAIGVLILALPASILLAGLFHLGVFGGRYEYVITWRVVAYPFGFALPFLAVPVAQWISVVFFLFLVVGTGLRTVQEIPSWRAFGTSLVVSLIVGVALYYFG